MLFGNLFFVIGGYLLGSILFAHVCGSIFRHREDITGKSPDGNPGTSNAFIYGGFWCGTLTLIGDVLKGFLPVFLYTHYTTFGTNQIWAALILCAPVIGHIWPLYFGFHGGKGIATSFGCLLGLLPAWKPLFILAAAFIFFSTILRITPNYYRTILTYICSLCLVILWTDQLSIIMGFALIVISILLRLLKSTEKKDKCKVKLLWMH